MNSRLFLGACALASTVVSSTFVQAQLAGALVINEFVASNDSVGGYREPDGGFGDWVELHNRSTRTLDLGGVNFSDDLAELNKWTFPVGISMAPGAYLIVWVDGDVDQTGIHTTFRLAKDGEDLVLSTGSTRIDSYTYGLQETNVSEARIPNGTGAFAKTRPTPNANNNSLGIGEVKTIRLEAHPNPAVDFVEVRWSEEAFTSYVLLDASGRVIEQGILDRGAQVLRVETGVLPQGLYRLSLDGGRAQASFVR